MAVLSFSDLHTESGFKTLEKHLSGKTFISGDQISKDDVKVFGAVPQKPGEGFPNAAKWYDSVYLVLAARFPGQAVGVSFSGQTATSAPVPTTQATKEAAGDDDDDDLDLFGDETEEDKKAVEEREAAKKASSKKKESGKSSVLLDVKPWDDETDMKKLEETVRSIEMSGLLWGASKLVAVGYGIKKLQIMMTIVDDLVSVDTLIEERLTVEPANEYIQSCDIVAFNKI
jgi:elongation factor 1-beta